ncbi:MAG: phosphoribosylglycinamide formyltransferase [Rhodospirillaceae bacterium]|jgi:phosphoribosylglycinamide formyltransferase-1|nr:phosphoribosylglycinamide formyltransferase [Rhodospirillaceae bacterium]MBT4773873.1 phosphoribosylglycinamide formyltransferase [Rhodospirillaceae bacterium]MBT5357440.1 phosphoribosylglycinamide formyltransferase [Rhodospirillaceae bacterium]MBT5770451.1 phosphoribosylglycinamide formyltransferase [Rhodospirillaceae bacterium]MBT6310425.1 phosphoribosylglycinamide formyltransferase [Rhodospirillaceae bacterium]
MIRLKVGVLISGRGSNLQALIAACATPGFPAEIVLVVSNKPNAQGLDHARAAGIETSVIEHGAFPDRESFDRQVDEKLRASGAELVCLAGFMRLLSSWFVEAWRDKVVNIHPSLLPAFKGIDAHAQAIAAGVRLSGCTVHIVRPEMDAGPILVQAAVPVLPDDDDDTLAARILEAEHLCYPHAVRLLAEDRVKILDERAIIDMPDMVTGPLIHPRPV